MKSYYAFTGAIRYYGLLPKTVEVTPPDGSRGTPGDLRGALLTEPMDSSRWKEPPHLVLVNLPIEGQSEGVHLRVIESFIRRYGPLLGRKTSMGLIDGAPQFYESVEHFISFQALLRKAWAGEEDAIKALIGRLDVIPENRWVGSRGKAWLGFEDETICVNVPELERFICLLFLHDYGAGTLGICANPDCPARYFLLDRKGQQFCTHKCAVLINVRKFREREAARRTKRKAGRSR